MSARVRASVTPRPRPAPTFRPRGARLSAESRPVGKIVEIKGVVIDAVFPGHLPAIYNAIEIPLPAGEGGEQRTLIAEVQQHLGDERVRAVAMDATDGLARGSKVIDTGASISVPVGQ